MEKKERGKQLGGQTTRVRTGCGNLYITCNCTPEDKLLEVFAFLGKAGGCATCQGEALTRAVSLGLKYGVPAQEYAKELENLRCPSPSLEDGEWILSCADALAKVLKNY